MIDITLSELNEMASRLPNPDIYGSQRCRIIVPRRKSVDFYCQQQEKTEPIDIVRFERKLWSDGNGKASYRWTINREIVV